MARSVSAVFHVYHYAVYGYKPGTRHDCTGCEYSIKMTSEERHEARYQRRKSKRAANRHNRSTAIGTLEDVFSFRDVFQYGTACCRNVRWKMSTQNFESHLFSRTAVAIRNVCSGTWKPKKCVHFTLRERGKVRPIDAPHIEDRHIQKVFTKKVLLQIYEPIMIEDNGASQKNKGLHWQFKRLKMHLQQHFKHHGRTGGVLLLDLKGFFPNANRGLIYRRHSDLIHDDRLRTFADYIITTAPATSPEHGMPLGLEVSQAEMVALPSDVDQWMRCQQGIRTMGHYMDDYYIIMPDLMDLQQFRDVVLERFRETGIPVNPHKCRIVPLTKPFRFCKTRFTLTETGAVRMNRCRNGMKRARRKLKKFRAEVANGTMTVRQAREFLVCQQAYYKEYDDHGRVLKLERLYHALFKEDK